MPKEVKRINLRIIVVVYSQIYECQPLLVILLKILPIKNFFFRKKPKLVRMPWIYQKQVFPKTTERLYLKHMLIGS